MMKPDIRPMILATIRDLGGWGTLDSIARCVADRCAGDGPARKVISGALRSLVSAGTVGATAVIRPCRYHYPNLSDATGDPLPVDGPIVRGATMEAQLVRLRDGEPDPGDVETLKVWRGAGGRIVKLVHYEATDEPDTPRYQSVRWTETTYTWRPRLKVFDAVTRANDLYPGKPDQVLERKRVPALPADLLAHLS